jgi:ATP-dependent RNA/DNA helicase IGHMBP2
MPATTPDHFAHLLSLLQQEREEDRQEYLRQVRQRPLHERVEHGHTWYPLNVIQTGFSLGEKAFLVVERTTRLHEPHQLRAGQSVNLFTQAAHVDQPEKQGVINFVERNRMKIILNARDVPDWLSAGQLGVDQMFDDRSYQEMVKALEKVMRAKGDRLAELRDILIGKKKVEYEMPAGLPDLPELNESQRAAVAAVLARARRDGDTWSARHGPKPPRSSLPFGV